MSIAAFGAAIPTGFFTQHLNGYRYSSNSRVHRWSPPVAGTLPYVLRHCLRPPVYVLYISRERAAALAGSVTPLGVCPRPAATLITLNQQIHAHRWIM